MPLCVLAESGRVGFPAVHSSTVAVVHRQVHLRKMSYARENIDYQALMVGPGAKLEIAYLLIKRKPGHVHLDKEYIPENQRHLLPTLQVD